MSLHMLRAEANRKAQDALHKLVEAHLRTGHWDRHLAAEWHAAEVHLDEVDDRIRDMAADTAEPDGWGLPDIALASVDTFDRWHQYLDR